MIRENFGLITLPSLFFFFFNQGSLLVVAGNGFVLYRGTHGIKHRLLESITEPDIRFNKRFTNCRNNNTTCFSGFYVLSVNYHSNPKRLIGINHYCWFIYEETQRPCNQAQGSAASKEQGQFTAGCFVILLGYTC